MYLCNIVTNNKYKLESFVNVVENINDIDKTIPTLIIGWKQTKLYYPNQNMLDELIEDNIYWTFDKKENRFEYEKKLSKFYESIFKKIINDINYVIFDIKTAPYSQLKRFINFISNDIHKCIYIHNNSFAYINFENHVLGVSLDNAEYLGINKQKVIAKLKKNKNNKVFYDNGFKNKYIKTFFKEIKIITPYIYGLVNRNNSKKK